MTHAIDLHTDDLLERVIEAAKWRLGPERAASLEVFLRHYYAGVPAFNLRPEEPDALFGAAFAHHRLGTRRPPRTALVRVYNPRLEEHGWRSAHTIVEIVVDDMPFLVDSVTAEINRRDLAVHAVVHPVFQVRRGADGTLETILPPAMAGTDGIRESFMHLEITHQADAALDEIAASIAGVLKDVRLAVEDWQPMRARLKSVSDELRAIEAPAAPEETEEAIAFLDWLHDNNFTFLGYRAYRFEDVEGLQIARVETETALGLLRQPSLLSFEDFRDGAPLPSAVKGFISRPEPLLVTKSNRVATVHRPVHMDAISVKRMDGAGQVVGQHLFLGLFASPAYSRSARNIPWLRLKVNRVLSGAGFAPRSHDGRALVHILETFPRDELFQASDDHLLATAIGILNLQYSQRVAIFIRRDDFDRFISCLVYIPRDRYSTELRLKIQGILERAFQGRITAHYGQVGDAPHARLQVYIKTTPGQIPPFDPDEVEAQIAQATRTWSDGLRDSLYDAHGEEDGRRLFFRYRDAFPPGYRDRFSGIEAVADVDLVEQALAASDLRMALYRPFWASEHHIRFKLIHPDAAIPLSQVLPMLEHLGVRVIDEVPHVVRVAADGARTAMIHDFGLETLNGRAIDLGAIREGFQETFLAVWRGQVENDRFNGLVLGAGLRCRQVVVLRAYCKYLRQAGIPFSQAYMEEVLQGNPALARDLVILFETLFDPNIAAPSERDDRAEALKCRIIEGLESIESADDDRIIRRFLNVILSTLRTNYFQEEASGDPKEYLSLKLDSRGIDELPAPRPMVEVFVYAPTMEGVHLRGGKVARGGIRWSDRREDFRTEVLGLMKAQMVKNAVIVPVGAKGGFIVKRPRDPSDREAWLAEGIACYHILIRGLLDVTDNLVGGDIVSPPSVVRRDDDDPYLVVAADKGTATFSDIANGIARDYGFWLGDAFASGGSQGYDHKKMGITARGAWECVKRHFRELDMDIQTQDFTVVGVGDMSGDVFGNAMLLSPHIKLVAAFDHRHIFIDPSPDPAMSLKERQRLFALPRSSWMDYDRQAISPGGGVFDRRAKALTVSADIRARFGLGGGAVTPSNLIRAVLRADVDLLWFGGIGTYVKSSRESHAEVGDRANDALRVDAKDLRCKVIGEGANLGCSQLGRIEFAQGGGRINADFIDNAAGVDCSDHEVNIKILLDRAVADGDLTLKQRNGLLVAMTDEVAALVLRDNYLQSQAISLIEANGHGAIDTQIRLIHFLERQGHLDRTVDVLPDDDTLAERQAARQGLVRPEIAILLSHGKIWLSEQLLASELPEDRHLAVDLERYFPTAIRERFRDRIASHPLNRELISTTITNSLINRMGVTFVTEIAEKTGFPALDIARAYIIARDVFHVREIWEQIEALDNRVPARVQIVLHREVQRLLERATQWFLHNGGRPLDIAVNVAAFDQVVTALTGAVERVLPDTLKAQIDRRAERYVGDGVPADLARRVADLMVMPSACDIVRLSAARGVRPEDVASLYFRVGELLCFGWLRYQAERLPGSFWHKMASAAVVEDLFAHQREITRAILDGGERSIEGALERWQERHQLAVDRARALLSEIAAATEVDLPMLTVASQQLGALRTA